MKRLVAATLSLAALAVGVAAYVQSQAARPSGKRATAPAEGGIQWFAALDAALAEAKRTERPLLLVSAAPHCGGVSGIW